MDFEEFDYSRDHGRIMDGVAKVMREGQKISMLRNLKVGNEEK